MSPNMGQILTLFATRIYQAKLAGRDVPALNRDLRTACLSIARDDKAGQAWCRANAYHGYTSYSSLNDLPVRAPQFAKEIQLEVDVRKPLELSPRQAGQVLRSALVVCFGHPQIITRGGRSPTAEDVSL